MLGAWGFGACGGGGSEQAIDPRRPNVLYLTGDDLGTRLGAYGHEAVLTPRIDALAAGGVLFERCYCQIAMCGPSRVSILTGLRPSTTGVFGNHDDWRASIPGAVTVGRHFRDSGYRTFAVGKINDPRNGPLDDAWVDQPEQWGIDDSGPALAMLSRLADGADDRPYFLAVGFRNPHCPWTPSSSSRDRYREVDVASELGPGRTVPEPYGARCAPTLRDWGDPPDPRTTVTFSEEEAKELAAGYLASVTDLDAMVGEVLDHADGLGLLRNTIVVFWSGDHGYALGDNGNWGKWRNDDASTRIPLIMHLPDGRSAGRRVPGIVEAVDMYPTLIELCGLDAPRQALEGLSFAPLLDEPDRSWKRGAFSQFGEDRSVKTERHDLIVRGSGIAELYDLIEDPMERTDLAAAHPEVVERLRDLLEAGPAAASPR